MLGFGLLMLGIMDSQQDARPLPLKGKLNFTLKDLEFFAKGLAMETRLLFVLLLVVCFVMRMRVLTDA